MESPDANYDNVLTPVPIVVKVRVGEAISNNLIPLHVEYEDNLGSKRRTGELTTVSVCVAEVPEVLGKIPIGQQRD